MRVPGPRALLAFWAATLSIAGGGAGILEMLGPPDLLPRDMPSPVMAESVAPADSALPTPEPPAAALIEDAAPPEPVAVAALLPLAGRRLETATPLLRDITAPVPPPVMVPGLPDWSPPGPPMPPLAQAAPMPLTFAALAAAVLPAGHAPASPPPGPAGSDHGPIVAPVIVQATLPPILSLIQRLPALTQGIAAALEPPPLNAPPEPAPAAPPVEAVSEPAVPEPTPAAIMAPTDPPQPADPIRTTQLPAPPEPVDQAAEDAAPPDDDATAARPEAGSGPEPTPADAGLAPRLVRDAPPPAQAARPEGTAVQPPVVAAPSPAPPAPSLPPAMIVALLRRGEAMLAQGDVSAARLLFERAAQAGSGAAALALAHSYDPRFLAELGTRGLRPDPAAAARWYERADALGEAEATRLRQGLPLAPRPSRGQAPAAEEPRP